jgi:hypothetical protein
LVGRLVELYWRKQRLDRYEHSKLQQRVQQIRQDNESSREIERLKNWGPKFNDATSLEEVDEILLKIDDVYADTIEKRVPYDETPNAAPRGPAIATYLSNIQPIDRLEGTARFIAIVDPDLIETDMARSDRIDEAIDRTIKRLMQVKMAKQIFPKMRNAKAEPKLINTPASTAGLQRSDLENQLDAGPCEREHGRTSRLSTRGLVDGANRAHRRSPCRRLAGFPAPSVRRRRRASSRYAASRQLYLEAPRPVRRTRS